MEENVEIKTEIKEIEKNKQEIGAVLPKNMADQVTNVMTNYVKNGLVMPKDYNYQNAIISSYLVIKQDSKLIECEKNSIASALVDMATLGLNVSKQQGYFIPYGGKLNFQPSYFGKITAIKRIKGVVDVVADVIYKGTEYELTVDNYGNDDIKINKPCALEERNFENLIGAWAKIILDESIWGRKTHTCVMTMEQIRKAWNQGQMKGQSPAHKNFTDEMAKKSAINRCCKNFVNSAKDNDILIETLNRTTANEYENDVNMNNQNVVGEAQVVDI